ncbi:MAG: Gfo/Idh/MocA family oxidoreductase [Verrucomicrobiota bacterium]
MNKQASARAAGIFNRRQFLKTAGAAMVLPLILPGCATGPARRVRPSNRINVGVIGWGMQGPANTKNLMFLEDCRVVAACDLDKTHLQDAVNTINGYYKNKDCKTYHDYRELLASDDIDAVMIAVPDHWHELIATEAARRKKDIYGEKPLAKTIAEQQAIVRAVQKNNIIWQTGSWQRSLPHFHKAAEIVRSGLIGKITRVEVGLPSGHNDFAKTAPELLARLKALKIDNLASVLPGTPAWDIAVTPPPAELDYDMWIGPSKMEPYIKQRVYKNWRWNYNTGGGQLLDWVGHHVDIAHWGLGFDNSGPSEIEGHGEFPAPNALWNTCTKYRVELKYPQDVTMIVAGGHNDIKTGTKWIGTDGWVWVNRSSESNDKKTKEERAGFDCSNPDWKKGKHLAEELRKVKLYESSNHQRNFIDCVKSRKPTITPVETAHHSAIPGHLGLISLLTGRKIRWDNATETILGDPEASKLLSREYRAPWKPS